MLGGEVNRRCRKSVLVPKKENHGRAWAARGHRRSQGYLIKSTFPQPHMPSRSRDGAIFLPPLQQPMNEEDGIGRQPTRSRRTPPPSISGLRGTAESSSPSPCLRHNSSPPASFLLPLSFPSSSPRESAASPLQPTRPSPAPSPLAGIWVMNKGTVLFFHESGSPIHAQPRVTHLKPSGY